GGFFDFGSQLRGLARWNGSHWVPFGGLFGGQYVWVNAMTAFNAGNGAELYLGGRVSGAGATPSTGIVRWNGANWLPLGSGLGPTSGTIPATVNALQLFDDGAGLGVYVAGTFSSAGGVPVNDIAKWSGTQWSALGSGADGPDGVY